MAQRLHGYAHFYLSGLCAAGDNHFNDILLVFTHVNGTMSQTMSPVRHWLLKIDC